MVETAVTPGGVSDGSRRLLPSPEFDRATDRIESQAGLAEQLIQLTESLRRSAGHGDDHFVEFFAPAVEQTFRHADHGHFVDALLPFLRVIVEESDDDSAKFLFGDQLQREFRARASGPDDADSRRRIDRRVFLSRRALEPPPQQHAKATEQRNRQKKIDENEVPRRAAGAGGPPGEQTESSQAQRGADLPQFGKTEVAEQSPALITPSQAPKLQGEHHRNLTPKLKRGHCRWHEIVNQLAGEPKGCRQDDSISCQHADPIRTDGSHNDPGIAQQVRALGVFPIDPQLSRHALLNVKLLQVVRVSQQHLLVAETQRCQIGDPGLAPQNVTLFRSVMLDVAGNLGSRADQTHFARQYIPKLWQFVQLRPTQGPADPGNASIAVLRDERPDLLRRGHHRAEFADSEWSSLKTNPYLTVENVSPIGNFYERANQQKRRAERHQTGQGKNNVVETLGRGEGPDRSGLMRRPARSRKDGLFHPPHRRAEKACHPSERRLGGREDGDDRARDGGRARLPISTRHLPGSVPVYEAGSPPMSAPSDSECVCLGL